MPRGNAGLAEEPVEQVAERAAEQQPERERPPARCRSRRDARTMATLATVATTVKIQVLPVANEKAAPGLRKSRSWTSSPTTSTRAPVAESAHRPGLRQLV